MPINHVVTAVLVTVKRENTEFMANSIPGAGLLIQPQISHFSFLQDPQQFTRDVLHFLEHAAGELLSTTNESLSAAIAGERGLPLASRCSRANPNGARPM